MPSDDFLPILCARFSNVDEKKVLGTLPFGLKYAFRKPCLDLDTSDVPVQKQNLSLDASVY